MHIHYHPWALVQYKPCSDIPSSFGVMALNMYVGVRDYVHLKSPLSLDVYATATLKNCNWMLCLLGNRLSTELA